MTLQDFAGEIEPKIIKRGEDYFAGGLVEELWQEEQGCYCAVVDGSEPYGVVIHIDEQGNILEHSCDCPYEWGEYCKHEVAVLLAIKQHQREKTVLPTARQGKHKGLRELLESCSKETLIDMILEVAGEYGLRQELRYYIEEEEWDE